MDTHRFDAKNFIPPMINFAATPCDAPASQTQKEKDDNLMGKFINCRFFEDVDVTGIIDKMPEKDLMLDVDVAKGKLMDGESDIDGEECVLPFSWFDEAHNFDLCPVR